MRYLITLILFFNITIWGDGHLPFDLKEKIEVYPLNSSSYSIYIESLNSDTPIASWNAHKKEPLHLLLSY